MKSTNLRFALFFYVGVLLLVTPLGVFHAHVVPHVAVGSTISLEPYNHEGKLLALRYFAVSMTGLALIVLALVSQYFKRRARRLEDTQA